LAFVAAPVVDRKADVGTAEMETIAEAWNLSPVEVRSVAEAGVDSECGLAVVEIDARSIPIPSFRMKHTRINPARLSTPRLTEKSEDEDISIELDRTYHTGVWKTLRSGSELVEIRSSRCQSGKRFLPMKMKIRLKNFNHILSFHILSQQKCNLYTILSVLGLYMSMQTHSGMGVRREYFVQKS
jgi:hypothetical protein